jgi:hypothetical protein
MKDLLRRIKECISEKTYAKSGIGKWMNQQSAGGGPGWDRYSTTGSKLGKCGDAEEGEPYSACLSRQKADKLGKKGIASFVRRKREAQKDAGRGEIGDGEKGKKPVYVKTGITDKDPKKKGIQDDWSTKYKKSIDCNNPKGFSQRAHCQGKEKRESLEEKNDTEAIFELPTIKKAIEFGRWAKKVHKSVEEYGYYFERGKIMVSLTGVMKDKNKRKEIEDKLNTLWDKAGLVKHKDSMSSFFRSPYPQRESLEEKNEPQNPTLWKKAINLAKQKFDVYPSVYANAWASKWYKEQGGTWRRVSES